MTSPRDPSTDPRRVPDEDAYWILARALDLDETLPLETSVDDLRDAAKEAGISVEAFEQALAEFRVVALRSASGAGGMSRNVHRRQNEPGLAGRLWRRPVGTPEHSPHDSASSIGNAIVRNLGAFAGFWLMLSLSSRLLHLGGVPWQIDHIVEVFIEVFGVALAVRLNARPVAFGLAGMAVAGLAKYLMHLGFGIETVQGGPTQLAVIIAGILGAIIGGAIIGPAVARRGQPPADANAAGSDPARRVQASTEPGPRRLLSLRARPT